MNLHYLKVLFRVYGNIARLGAFDTSLIFPGTVVIRLLNREDAKDTKEEVGRSRKK